MESYIILEKLKLLNSHIEETRLKCEWGPNKYTPLQLYKSVSDGIVYGNYNKILQL